MKMIRLALLATLAFSSTAFAKQFNLQKVTANATAVYTADGKAQWLVSGVPINGKEVYGLQVFVDLSNSSVIRDCVSHANLMLANPGKFHLFISWSERPKTYETIISQCLIQPAK